MPSTRTLRRIALAAASVLVAGSVVLAPVPPARAAETFGSLSVTGVPARLTVPLADTPVPFAVSFTGPPATGALVYRPWNTSAGQQIAAGATPLATNQTTPLALPSVAPPPAVAPGTLTYSLGLSPYTTPGRYQLTVPIEQLTWNEATGAWSGVSISASVQFEVIANPVLTSAPTWSILKGSGAFSKKARWSWTFNGPDYERGATVKIYYKAKGARKYAVVASGRLNASGDAAFRGNKGRIRKTGKAYYVLGAVPFSPLTKSGQYLIAKAGSKA